MTKVGVIESVEASAADVWAALSDFGGIKVGGPITDFSIEGEGVGAVRTISMGAGQVIERLDQHDADNMVFAYSILNDDNPLPVTGYSARVAIVATGDASCEVEWVGVFKHKGDDESAAIKAVRGIYTGGIQGARKALAS